MAIMHNDSEVEVYFSHIGFWTIFSWLIRSKALEASKKHTNWVGVQLQLLAKISFKATLYIQYICHLQFLNLKLFAFVKIICFNQSTRILT